MREGHYRIQGENKFTGGELQVNALKQYVLVAGMDYNTANSFIKYCNDYKAKITANNRAKDDLTFIIVDLKGSVEVFENGISTSIKYFDKISKSNYPDRRNFSSLGKSNYITKKTIYDLVEKIGLNKPGTLQELNIFSHAYAGGPILANSSEDDDIDLDMRKNDLRNRIFDFANFKQAFTDNGIVKIWGCQSHPPFNFLLKRVMQDPQYRKDGSTPDSEEFIIKNAAFENYGEITDYLAKDAYTELSNNRIVMTLLQLKKTFSYDYCNNFAGFLAAGTDMKVQYALPATYASFGSPDYFRISDDTIMNIEFYNAYLKIPISELGYGIYEKTILLKYVNLYFPSL